jgi:hypothetical protein
MMGLATAWHRGEVRPTHQKEPKAARHWRNAGGSIRSCVAARDRVARVGTRSNGERNAGTSAGGCAGIILRRPASNSPASGPRVAKRVHSSADVRNRLGCKLRAEPRRIHSVRNSCENPGSIPS